MNPSEPEVYEVDSFSKQQSRRAAREYNCKISEELSTLYNLRYCTQKKKRERGIDISKQQIGFGFEIWEVERRGETHGIPRSDKEIVWLWREFELWNRILYRVLEFKSSAAHVSRNSRCEGVLKLGQNKRHCRRRRSIRDFKNRRDRLMKLNTWRNSKNTMDPAPNLLMGFMGRLSPVRTCTPLFTLPFKETRNGATWKN